MQDPSKPKYNGQRPGPNGKFVKKPENVITPVNSENVQDFIPKTEVGSFPIEGGRVVPERGAKYGRAKGNREWGSAVQWALNNYTRSTIERGAALRAIALRLVDKAIVEGDKDAISEIANRLDGKAVQAVAVKSESDSIITIVHRTE